MILSGRLTMLLLVVCGLFLVPNVAAAWQEIADFVDCGSTNFVTERILVDFNADSYWLNVSVVGEFANEIVDADPTTNKICMSHCLAN
jgi:hypothetical protein